MEVQDLRGTERFVISEAVAGSYGAVSIAIVDISPQGAQIAHAQPLRLGGKGRLSFRHGGLNVTAQGLTIWSRFAKSAETSSNMRYRSGIRIESDISEFATAVQSLIDRGLAQPDPESLERKRRRVMDRNVDKTSKLVVKGFNPEADIPNDQILLIQHARDQLRANPIEALKWYNRAKYAAGVQIAEAIPNREEVLAVWEYLERSVDVPTIATVFERLRKTQGSSS
jgi:hypothetical protein